MRPDSLQRAGASGLLHQLLVRFGTDVETLDEEALGDEWSDGKGTNLTLSDDIKDTRRECACGMTMNDADTT